MNISEVRIKLMNDPQQRLLGFCSITLDRCFVIRDLKIIRGTKGPFVAMPSRKLTDRCPKCKCKNHLRARFCNQCGTRLAEDRAEKDEEGRAKLYADIAHPINSRCREMIQKRVLRAYEEELEASKKPGYVCRYDVYDYMGDENGDDVPDEPEIAASEPAAEMPRPESSTASSSAASSTEPVRLAANDAPADRPGQAQPSAADAASPIVDTAGRAHRIESGTSAPPSGPHHAVRPARNTAHHGANSNTDGASRNEEDEFGAGVV